jgi:hypothetical protein
MQQPCWAACRSVSVGASLNGHLYSTANRQSSQKTNSVAISVTVAAATAWRNARRAHAAQHLVALGTHAQMLLGHNRNVRPERQTQQPAAQHSIWRHRER